jgi:hypothetical protein
MNSYFTDLVGDEDKWYLFDVQLRQHLNEVIYKTLKKSYNELGMDNFYIDYVFHSVKLDDEMCSCGSRQKHKCIKESESGYGKMCFKGEE